MTVHVLITGPPRQGFALPGLVEDGPLDTATAATVARAAIKDVATAVASSGGDLLVNYPQAASLPDRAPSDETPEGELRDLVDDALGDLSDVRFEVQVGDDFAARAGNAATQLLDREGVDSVAVLDGRAPTLNRTTLDEAAMKLRRNEVVLGPAPGGRVTYVGFSVPLDLTGAWRVPELVGLAERGRVAGHAVDFLPLHPRVDAPAGLASVVALIVARREAGRRVPEYTAAAIDELGLEVVERADGGRTVRVGETEG